MRDFKNIKAYQYADKLVMEIYRKTKKFPKEEQYGLISQIRRAAVSVPANIAEGASRQHKKDYLNFLYIARGSLCELEYLIGSAFRLEYLVKEEFETIDQMRQEVSKTLAGLIGVVEIETIREPDELYASTVLKS